MGRKNMNTGYIISDFYLSHTLNHIHKNPKLNAIEAVRCMFGRAVCWLKYNDKCDCIKSLHFLLSCISSFSISIRMHLTWLWLDVIPYVTSSSLLLLYTGAKKLTAIVSLSVFVYKRNLGHTERTERKNIIMFCKLKPSVHTDTLKKKNIERNNRIGHWPIKRGLCWVICFIMCRALAIGSHENG